MRIAFIALGSNLGDRLAWLQLAAAELQAIASHIRFSPVYEGAAHTLHPDDVSPDFLNAVIEVHTNLGRYDLLDYCQRIEQRAKRQRHQPYAPRTLDLDILTLGDITCHTERITLPHPRLQDRRFVLQPWSDLAPDSYIPSPINDTVGKVLARCKDRVNLVKTPWLLVNSVQNGVPQSRCIREDQTV